jgi:hypothetical protein
MAFENAEVYKCQCGSTQLMSNAPEIKCFNCGRVKAITRKSPGKPKWQVQTDAERVHLHYDDYKLISEIFDDLIISGHYERTRMELTRKRVDAIIAALEVAKLSKEATR